LEEFEMKPFCLGIAGTAKNTGKTTTLSALLDEIKKDTKIAIAITSIGYDGETIDNVTGLPKPRVEVWEGCITAIAERCMTSGSAQLKPLITTNIMTPLGRIVIAEVVTSGKIVLAGPNSSGSLRTVLDIFGQMGVTLTVVDGALSRIAPMSEADAIILATGAAKNTDIEALTLDTKHIIDIFKAPVLEPAGTCVTIPSVLSDAGYQLLLNTLDTADTVLIDGVCSDNYISRLAKQSLNLRGKRLIFHDPVKILISGDANRIHTSLSALTVFGAHWGVAKSIKPLAVTINPFYPRLRYTGKGYDPAYVNRDFLYESISQHINTLCFDVVQHGGDGLYKELIANLKL